MNLVSWSNRIIEYSFYSIFFLVPLVFTGDTSELFELNKMWLTWGFAIIIAVAWGTKITLQRKIHIQRTPLDIPIMLFLASQVISTLFSLDAFVSWWGYYSRWNGGLLSTITYIFLFYAFVSNYKDLGYVGKTKLNKWMYLGSIGVLALMFLFSLGVKGMEAESVATRAFLMGSGLVISLILLIWSYKGHVLEKLLFVSLNAGLITALWGFPAHFGLDPTCLVFRGSLDTACWTDAFKPTIRSFSSLGQPAWFAAYMALLIPIAIAGALVNPLTFKKPMYWVFFALALFFYINLNFTGTRAGFYGLWGAYAVFWGIILIKRLLPLQLYIRSFAIFTGALLFMNFLFGVPVQQLQSFTLQGILASNALKQQTQTIQTQPQTNPTEHSVAAVTGDAIGGGTITDSKVIRGYVWQGAIDAWKANPIFGTGVETFAFAYYKYKPAGQNTTSEWNYLYNKAHNEYLNYLTTTGIFGLGSYLAFIALFLFITGKWLLKKGHRTEESQDIGLEEYAKQSTLLITGLLAGFITILITNWSGFSVVIINLYLFFIPLLVLIIADLINEHKVYKVTFSESNSPKINGFQWTVISILLVLGIILSWGLVNYRSADISYALGMNLNKVGSIQEAYPLLENAVKAVPVEPVYKDELAINLATLATALQQQPEMQNQAVEARRMAIAFSDQVIAAHPNNVTFYKNRVRIFYTLAQIDPANQGAYLIQAANAITKAAELAPNDASILYNLGVLYGQTGNPDRGIEILNKTVAMKPDYRDAYFALGVFYHEKSLNKNGKVVDAESHKKAIETYEYILEKIAPTDKQVQTSLDTWKNL